MTPADIALDAVVHAQPSGSTCEPAAGEMAFVHGLRSLGLEVDFYELKLQRDFLAVSGDEFWDYTITNPPYSKLRRFLRQCMDRSNNVVLLVLEGALGSRARRRDIERAGFGVVEVTEVPIPSEWPTFGMRLGLVWLRRGWSGCQRDSYLYPEQVFSPCDRTFRFTSKRQADTRGTLCVTGRGSSLRLLDDSGKFLTRPFALQGFSFDADAIREATILKLCDRGPVQQHALVLTTLDGCTTIFDTTSAKSQPADSHEAALIRLSKDYRAVAHLADPAFDSRVRFGEF